MDIQALTLKGTGLMNVLKTDVLIQEPFIGQTHPKSVKCAGIWDTGASASEVTAKIVNELGFKLPRTERRRIKANDKKDKLKVEINARS